MGILLLAAARGTTHHDQRRRAGRGRRRRGAGASWSNPASVRSRGTPEGNRRLGRAGRRTRARRHPADAGHPLSDRARSRRARAVGARARARCARTSSCKQIRGRIAELQGADLAAIFDAQLLMLDDPMLVGRAADHRHGGARQRRVGGAARARRARRRSSTTSRIPYLHERKGDLHDVAGRLRMNLRGEKGGARDLLQDLDTPCVLVADELTPSVVAQLDWTRIRGFATDAGSRTYHTAILARSLGVPAVVGLHDVSTRIPPGASVIIDGDTGDVIIDPSPPMRQEAEARTRLAQAATCRAPRPLGRPDRDARRRPHPAARQHRAVRRRGGGAGVGRRRHRPVSVGVPAGRRAAGHGGRGRAVPRVPAGRGADGADGR